MFIDLLPVNYFRFLFGGPLWEEFTQMMGDVRGCLFTRVSIGTFFTLGNFFHIEEIEDLLRCWQLTNLPPILGDLSSEYKHENSPPRILHGLDCITPLPLRHRIFSPIPSSAKWEL